MTFADEENKTLYAHWTKKTCTVKFNANGGSVSPKSVKVPKGSAYSGYLVTPSHEDKIFMGWYTKKTDGEKVLDTSIC